MRRTRNGFTLTETVFALVIASVLLDIGFTSMSGVMDRMSVTSSTASIVSLHARTRAHAIERGRDVVLKFDVANDSVWIQDGADRIETLRFGGDTGIGLVSTHDVEFCFTARGYGDSDCSSFTAVAAVSVQRGSETRSIVLLPLGRLIVS